MRSLRRRTNAPLEVAGAEGRVTIPPGELVEVLLDRADTDSRTVGDLPERLCPGRPMSSGAGAYGLSFGDGPTSAPARTADEDGAQDHLRGGGRQLRAPRPLVVALDEGTRSGG